MKKSLFLLVVILISAFATANAADFSGKWKLNRANSKLNDQFTMAPNELIVVQNENELNLEKHSTFQNQDFITNDKFTLDGKECINKGWRDSQKKSTASWSDDKSSLKITTKIPMRDNGEMTIVEVYKLNGNTLVNESQGSSSFGEMKETYIFDKQ